MNILILENRGSVSYYMKRALEEEGCIVFDATNIYDANSYYENKQIDCLIIDLQMDPEGLKEKEITQTKNGLLTGWIWLSEYVFKKNIKMKEQTIIVTDYYDELVELTLQKERRGIYIVQKRSSESPAQTVMNYVNDIFEKIKARS